MRSIALAALTFLAFAATASAQDAVTAACNDGTSWSGARRSGACRGHQGVKSFGTAAAATAVAAAATPTGTPAASAATPVPQTAMGGAGQVWVNTASHVYHCPGDRYYGHTKSGQYMTEAAAKSAGDRPDHNKACSS